MSSGSLHPAARDPADLLAECEILLTRRSGPGGQHRNKTQTAVVLVHRPSGLRAEAAERRSQQENRSRALSRLRLRLAIEIRRPVQPGGPSELWRSRCLGGRIAVNREHRDFPALLAEAMDVLSDRGLDMRAAAESLVCSPSQLLKLFKLEPAAMESLNRQRAAAGLHRLA